MKFKLRFNSFSMKMQNSEILWRSTRSDWKIKNQENCKKKLPKINQKFRRNCSKFRC